MRKKKSSAYVTVLFMFVQSSEYIRVKQSVLFRLITVLERETCTSIIVVVGSCKVVVVG
jgi:hypothetical protein